jgi:hypothetical protein
MRIEIYRNIRNKHRFFIIGKAALRVKPASPVRSAKITIFSNSLEGSLVSSS